MLIFDSGLGGLCVVRALRAHAPDLPLRYLADSAAFPYGARSASELTQRATLLLQQLDAQQPLTGVVLACNTLSTLCLSNLRARFSFPIIGTVPAIKVAAGHARRFTLLATPNTAQSDYTRRLITEFAPECRVDCYGAPHLASYAERHLLGDTLAPALWEQELAPAFFDDAQGRTEAIVLGCTHYPLVLPFLQAAAPWEVTWIDSSDAIARRALSQMPMALEARGSSTAYVTRAEDVERYAAHFAHEGFAVTEALLLRTDSKAS